MEHAYQTRWSSAREHELSAREHELEDRQPLNEYGQPLGPTRPPGKRTHVAEIVDRAIREGTRRDLPHRREMERAFGESFADVEAYSSTTAADAMGARAFALGNRIVFRDPSPDVALVAHELTHVVQQRDVLAAAASDVSSPGDAHEIEADEIARAVASGSIVAGRVRARGHAVISRAAAGDEPVRVASNMQDQGEVEESRSHLRAGGAVTTATRGVTKRDAPGGDAQIKHGLGYLEDTSVGLLLRAHARHQAPTQTPPGQAQLGPDALLPLIRVTGRILYLGYRLHVLDRNGYLVPGVGQYRVKHGSLKPGGIYFLAKLRAALGAARSEFSTLFRLDLGLPQIASGDFSLTEMNEGLIPLTAELNEIGKGGAGIAIIVSPYAYDAPRDRGDGATTAFDRAPLHLEREAKRAIAAMVDDLPGLTVNLLTGEALDWLAKAAPLIGQTLDLADWLEQLTTVVDAVNIARNASSDDEIDFAAQALARAFVTIALGELTSRLRRTIKGGKKSKKRRAPDARTRNAKGAPRGHVTEEGPETVEPTFPGAHSRTRGILGGHRSSVLRRLGGDLHTHFMGVLDDDYFVSKLGAGDPRVAFDRIHAFLDGHPEARKSAAHAWNAAKQARAELDALERQGASIEELHDVADAALTKMLAAGDHTPFDKPYALREVLVENLIDPGGGPYRNYARDTLAALAAEGIDYSEQSVGLNKLYGQGDEGHGSKFPEEMMRELRQELAAAGQDVDIRFLAMVNTRALTGTIDVETARATRRKLEAVLLRGDVIGIDVAGPEKDPFTPEGMKNFRELYAIVSAAAKKRTRPLVLRPHVGEGYDVARNGAHVEIARQNLELLIQTLEDMSYDAARAAEDGVLIRFGHATHATTDQIARIQRLGVTIEANIGSNLKTGSIVTPDEHPLLYYLYHGVPVTLGTDAGGVMGTKLEAELTTAQDMIADFRNGKTAIVVDGVEIRYQHLTAEQKENFDPERLLQWDDQYRTRVRAGDEQDSAR